MSGAARSPGPQLEAVPAEALDALSLVLDEIRLGRSRSRSEIAQRTGLSRGIVAQRLGELVARGLVAEEGIGPSTGGRPPRQLAFCGDVGHMLVADVGATSIDVAVTDLEGRILGHRAEAADVRDGPEVILGRIEELFRELLGRTPVPGRLWGIGIGVPGPVEFGRGRLIAPPIMPGWDGYPIRERFSARYDAPVWVDNDVNLLVLSEWRSGIGQGHDNIVLVKIGTGIGAGIISDGRLHRGAQGSAGDVGHIQVAHDVLCHCGNVGCVEAVASGAAIARAAEAAAREGASRRLEAILEEQGSVSAKDVAHAASYADAVAVELLRTSGRRVGSMLAGIVNFFNPSLIVISGGVAQSGDALLAAIRETVYQRSLPLATRRLQIERSSLGGLGGVIGAATMVSDQLFSRSSIARWIAVASPAGMRELVGVSGGDGVAAA